MGIYGHGNVYARGGQPDKWGKLKSGSWWIAFSRNGVLFRESAHTLVKAEAQALLKQRTAEIVTGVFIVPADRKITVDDLYQGLLDDYGSKHLASLEGAQQRWEWRNSNHPEIPPKVGRIKAFFGGLKASQVGTDLLNKYVLKCQAEGLSDATINRDLAALKRAFNLAYRSSPRKVKDVPIFPHLREAAPRKGFVEEREYLKLCKHSAGQLWLRALLAVAYSFGFRRSELLTMRCEQVSLVEDTIRLWRGTTKSGEPRVVKLTNETRTLLAACIEGKRPEDFVFTRNAGQTVRDFRDSWASLCKDAGVPGLLFHDLRRSAVRNMIRNGVSERVAMTISGHLTRTIFDRYNIVSDADLVDAARKIEQHRPVEDLHKTYTVAEVGNRQSELSN